MEQALSGPTGVLKSPSPLQHYHFFSSFFSHKLDIHISVKKQFSVVFCLEKFFLADCLNTIVNISHSKGEKKDKKGKCINLNAALKGKR